MENVKTQFERVKLSREIAEINKEQQYIINLWNKNEHIELEKYLSKDISDKYLKEKIIHNAIYINRPITLEENVNNAINFLENIKRKKELELAEKIIYKNN